MGEIHCMFTSANKPFQQCLFWYISLSQPFYCPLLVVLWTRSCVQTAWESAETLLNERTFLAGFCLTYIRKDNPTLEKKEKDKRKQKHPGAINQSLQPMLSQLFSSGENRLTTLVAMSVPRKRGISIQQDHYK